MESCGCKQCRSDAVWASFIQRVFSERMEVDEIYSQTVGVVKGLLVESGTRVAGAKRDRLRGVALCVGAQESGEVVVRCDEVAEHVGPRNSGFVATLDNVGGVTGDSCNCKVDGVGSRVADGGDVGRGTCGLGVGVSGSDSQAIGVGADELKSPKVSGGDVGQVDCRRVESSVVFDGVVSGVSGLVANSGLLVGPNGGKSYGRGKNYARNQEVRMRKRRLKGFGKEKGFVSDVESKGKSQELQLSLERKWVVENALAEERAKQQLELLKSRDLDSVKKMQRAQVMRTTETCKVQTEKAFASLKKSGDVAGFAETVVSDPSLTEGSSARSSGDCISPDSSVSQQEIRRMQQENLEMQRALEKVKENDPKLHAFAMKMGGLKTAFTLDTNGDIPVDEEGEIGPDGKFHMMYPRANVTTIKQQNAMDREYNEYLNGFDC